MALGNLPFEENFDNKERWEIVPDSDEVHENGIVRASSMIHFLRDCAIAHNPSDPIPRGMLVKFVKFWSAVTIVISTMSRSL